MKQNALQIRTRLLTIMAGGFLATAASAASVGVGVDATVGAGAQVTAPDAAQAGGRADAHMSPSGSANSNGQWQSGATRGAERAAERMGTNSDGTEPSAAADLEASGKTAAKAKRPGTH